MVKKAILLFSVAACLSGNVATAQNAHCFADEMNARAKAKDPEAIAAAEAQLKAEIDRALGKMNLPNMKVTADKDSAWKDNEILRIPIVFHVVHNYGLEYVTDNQIYEALEDINDLYRGANNTSGLIANYSGNIPGTNIPYHTNTHIQFYLAQRDPLGQPTNGITRTRNFTTTSAGDHSKLDVWPRDHYMNIWIINSFDANHAGAAAYAYKPPSANAMPWADGPITYMQQSLNYDNTLAHEIGHSLDLDHPWGGTNSPEVACGDDGVDDTPPTDGHDPDLGCNDLEDIYDTKCVYGNVDTLGKPAINIATKETDNLNGVGIKFSAFDKINIDRVSIYPADSGKPFTIVLKHKTAPNTYVTIDSYSGITTDNKNIAGLAMPVNNFNPDTLDAETGAGITFRTYDSVAIRKLRFYTDSATAATNQPYTIVLKRNNVVIDTFSGVVTDSNQVVAVNFGVPFIDSNDLYSVEFDVNPGAKRQFGFTTTARRSVAGFINIVTDTNAQGLYNYFYDWTVNTFNYKQDVPVAFVAPIDQDTNAYSLEFSVNPRVHRDSNGAGTRSSVNNVIAFTEQTTSGLYNYFYDWRIRFGDYFVQYSPGQAAKLFNIHSTTPVVIDYPDTVNAQNVMDYTYCSKMFTFLQSVRMRAALRSSIAKRDSLITPYNLKITGVTDANGNIAPRADLPPVADFSVSVPFTCANSPFIVSFRNRSWRDTLSKINWSFSNGASNPNPVTTNPIMNTSVVATTFATPGWVTVQMIAESNAGKDTLVSSDRMYVADNTAIDPTGYFQEFVPGTDLDKYPIFNYFNNFTKWEVISNAGYADNNSMAYKQFDTRPVPNQLNMSTVGTARGDFDDFYTPAFDLTGFTGSFYMTFYTAGAFRTINPDYMTDEFEVSYSTDCGSSWNSLKKFTKKEIGNNDVILTDWTPGGFWDWEGKNIALSTIPTAARDQVYFRFRFKPGADPFSLIGTGNNFYIDRINISKWTTDVEDLAKKEAGFTLAPNPTNGTASVIIKDAQSKAAQITVTDVTGKLVYATEVTLNNNINRFEIPANYVSVKGVYLVTVVTGSQKQTEKLVVY